MGAEAYASKPVDARAAVASIGVDVEPAPGSDAAGTRLAILLPFFSNL